MTATYGWQALISVAVCTWAGLTVRTLINPRRALMSPARRLVTFLDSRTAIRLVQAMAALALLLSLLVGFKQYRMTACQAAYNEQSNRSQQARAEAAKTDRDALDKLLQVVADNPRGSIDAIRQYNQSRLAGDAQRASNPVPPPPSQTCG